MRPLFARWRRMSWLGKLALVAALVVMGWVASVWGLRVYSWTRSNSLPYIASWFTSRANRPALVTSLDEPCPGAPFLLPSSGLVGLLYADPAAPYTVFRRHTGLDIFGDGAPGEVPVVAAYEGYLSRLPDWKSTVIIRHNDPLRPGRTIWTYYTHMASVDGSVSFVHPDFPPGTSDVFVEQGRLLGHQGDFGGTQRVGLHLHFSIVKSDPDGLFLNESILANTLNPSPYLGMDLDARNRPVRPSFCAN